MQDTATALEPLADVDAIPTRRRRSALRLIAAIAVGCGKGVEWVFGIIALVLGLSILAAIPIAQFLTLGYFLESSARVAKTGRLRDGVIGIRKAARVGGMIAGTWLALVPQWVVRNFSISAQIIDPGSSVARGWRAADLVITLATLAYLALVFARGARLRHFIWPFSHPFRLIAGWRKGNLYREMRDAVYDFLVSLHLPRYFRIGLVGFLGTMAWLVVPSLMIAMMPKAPLVGILGVLLLAVIVPGLPFLQVRYAVEGRASALFSVRDVRDRFRRAPWAFAFALLILLAAAIPLYLLKIEVIPREAAWLPSLVFVVFLAPARLLTGWAYHRSARRETPRHWIFRVAGRLAILPVAMLYVLVVFFAQYTSWGGVSSLFEQHAFLLPVPFLGM